MVLMFNGLTYSNECWCLRVDTIYKLMFALMLVFNGETWRLKENDSQYQVFDGTCDVRTVCAPCVCCVPSLMMMLMSSRRWVMYWLMCGVQASV